MLCSSCAHNTPPGSSSICKWLTFLKCQRSEWNIFRLINKKFVSKISEKAKRETAAKAVDFLFDFLFTYSTEGKRKPFAFIGFREKHIFPVDPTDRLTQKVSKRRAKLIDVFASVGGQSNISSPIISESRYKSQTRRRRFSLRLTLFDIPMRTENLLITPSHIH